MAKISADKKSVTVQKGDTLSGIASYVNSQLGLKVTYQQLAAINGIKNPNLIYVNQVIKLYSSTSSGGGGSSTSSTTTTRTKSITKLQVGELSNAENTLFATWNWNWPGTTECFKVLWLYETGNGVWLGSPETINIDPDYYYSSLHHTFPIPENARTVKFRIKPISKTYGEKKTKHFDIAWTADRVVWTDATPIGTPDVPEVTIDKYKLTATLEGITIDATHIEFEVVKNNSSNVFNRSKAMTISTGYVSYSCDIDPGAQYKVRCRAVKNKQYSEWSEYSENKHSMPSTPDGSSIICRANSKTSVYLEWTAISTAETYDIEYATKKEYFDITSMTTVQSGIETTQYELTGLDTGYEYFFRIRAVNKDSVYSSWSEIVSTVIGTKPSAPTTWSSTTTAITGESLTLYWVHNSKDNSSQKYADLEVYVDGTKLTTIPIIENSTDEELKDKTSSYPIDTSSYIEGTKLEWRVRTSGVTNEFGAWSSMRVVNIYAPPTCELNLLNGDSGVISDVTAFPFYISALSGPNTQTPTSYSLNVFSNEMYETTDNIGNLKVVNAGDAVYSKYFDIADALMVEMSAGNINLENNVSYTVQVIVSMNSGLTVTETVTFTVLWEESTYEPNAQISVDTDSYSAYIRPYCEETTLTIHIVELSSDVYSVTSETVAGVFGEPVQGAKTETGEQVYFGVSEDGDEIYYCEVLTSSLVEGVSLSVYRREYDGGFTEIATGLDNSRNTTVTDPHPALDFARYRIVAISDDTGAVSYYDLPGTPVNCGSIIFQWNEAWTNFEVSEDGEMIQPPWSGSLLNFPYNVETGNSANVDVALVKYAGRMNPVSYYGTQVGEGGTLNSVIPKDDRETLYALHRLQKWAGDVYVRQPSGVGYWANVSVSFNEKYSDVIVPVSFSIKRVEGGV